MRIRLYRILLGLRQRDLARLIERDRSWITKVESGEIRPQPREAEKLRAVLGAVVF